MLNKFIKIFSKLKIFKIVKLRLEHRLMLFLLNHQVKITFSKIKKEFKNKITYPFVVYQTKQKI